MKKLVSGFFDIAWHEFQQKISQFVATFVATVFFLGIGTAFLPMPAAQAAVHFECPGLDAGGHLYTATYVDGLFTKVVFTRPGLPPVTSELTYNTVNAQGEPIYRGGYLGAADVILIDLSKGNVKPGSEVSVAVDGLWNQRQGVCGADMVPSCKDSPNYRPYSVQRGETLYSIAQQQLGDSNRWREILDEDCQPFTEAQARNLQAGQVVYVPSQPSSPQCPQGYRPYTARPGDTLYDIAQQQLGDSNRWREILNENCQTFTEAQARNLQAGQIVYVPLN